MNFKEYQLLAKETATYPNDVTIAYLSAGLTGEAGEVSEQIKKAYRKGMKADGEGIPDDRKENIFYEIGDVLWYCAMLAYEFDFDLQSVAEANIKKLQERHGR